jgi:hypothetical protein
MRFYAENLRPFPATALKRGLNDTQAVVTESVESRTPSGPCDPRGLIRP